MVTIAHLAEKIIEEKPFLQEALAKGIINYGALAESMQPDIEKELKKKVKTSAVMMALRRLSEKLEKSHISAARFDKDSDITVKSDLFEFTVRKSQSVFNNIKKLYDFIDMEKGDFLTITTGIHEVTVIANQKHRQKITKLFEKEKLLKTIGGLGSITIRIPTQSAETMGLFYVATRAFIWENINIFEIVSTWTELTLVVAEDDMGKAFKVTKQLLEQNK
jgi:aspartokinase